MEHVKKAYFLCAIPRSGSTMLCDMLSRTQIAGQPASYFRRQDISKWAEKFGLNASSGVVDEEYLEAVHEAGSSANGIFGARIMWDSMAEVADYLLDHFPSPNGEVAYVYLSRKDVISQAISLAKALQTGLWHVRADGSIQRSGPEQKATFDAALIDSCLLEIQEDASAWQKWFHKENIEPLEIVYEELVEDPKNIVGKVLTCLGQDPNLAASVEPGTSKMATNDNEEWRLRYLQYRKR